MLKCSFSLANRIFAKDIFNAIKAAWIFKDLIITILGDPGADSGGEGKSKQVGKYGTKKSKERREQPLGTMSYQTSSKLSQLFLLLIGARKLLCFSAQSEGRTAATIWNWSGKTLSLGALLTVLYFSLSPAHLDFPSPPLSAPGSARMYHNTSLHVVQWRMTQLDTEYYYYLFSMQNG